MITYQEIIIQYDTLIAMYNNLIPKGQLLFRQTIEKLDMFTKSHFIMDACGNLTQDVGFYNLCKKNFLFDSAWVKSCIT